MARWGVLPCGPTTPEAVSLVVVMDALRIADAATVALVDVVGPGADPGVIDIVGSYIPVIDIVGTYTTPVIDLVCIFDTKHRETIFEEVS